MEYVENNTRWHEDFGGAFQILVEHGYPRNHLVLAGQTLPILVDPDVEIPPTELHSSTDEGSDTSTNVNETIAITIVLILVVALLFGLFFLMIIVLH